MPSDFKDPPRYIADQQEWEFLRQILLYGKRCACGCGRKAETLHHLVNRSQGGDDVPGNLVPLAGDGTRLCHGALTSGNRTRDDGARSWVVPEGVRRGIRLEMAAHNKSYVKRKKGQEWLDKTYPTPT